MIGASRQQKLNPIEQTLAQCGLQHVAPNCTHLFRPGYGTDASKRHYPYERGSGWNAANVVLSRASAKNDVIGGVLKTLAAAELGANGRIEPQSINLSPVLSTWSMVGDAPTAGIDDPLGGTAAYRLTIRNTWTEVLYKALAKPEATYLFSCWVRSPSITEMRLGIDDAPAGVNISSAALPVTSSWTRVSALLTPRAGKTLGYLDIAQGYNGLGFASSQTGVLDIAFPNFSAGAYDTTTIPTEATRAADAWRVTGMSGLTTRGGLVAMFRTPYASTVPAADQYHIALNGSDSLDDAVLLYTESGDDKLYAELRSGGVSQGTIDLGAYSAATQYAVALGWDATNLTGAINGVAKTSTGAVTVPASLDRIEIGRAISTDTAHGGEIPLALVLDVKPTAAQLLDLSGAALMASAFGGL